MVTGAAIARAEGRFQSLRSRDAVSILYSSWASELPPMRRDNLPMDFRKYSGSRSIEFKPERNRSALFLSHCACPESENLVTDAFRDVAEDLRESLDKHQFTTGFRDRELDWAVALIEASHKGLLGSAGYNEVWWQDSTEDLLITGRIRESFAENVDVIDHYMVELTNAVESSLRLVEILETEPEAPKKPEPREKTADQKLQDLFEANPTFACTATLRDLARELGLKSASTILSTLFYINVLKGKRDAVKEIVKSKNEAEKRIRSGNAHVNDSDAIESADKALDEYFNQQHQVDRER